MADLTTSIFSSNVARYEIQERLGAGGMARVYKAWDRNLERTVAIKILHEHLALEPTFKERFEREAKFVAGFNHPHIVQVYDFNVIERDEEHIYYMVMQYIPGKTLDDTLEDHAAKDERMPRQQVLEIMLQLADGLGYAHERGMVHRDVKPGNILFNERGQVVLTDFGIARLAQGSNLTQEGVSLGTPAYMSPEQVAGGQIDHRTDLYALGVILYEMLTGEHPFKDDGSLSVLLKHLNAPVPSISKLLHMEDPYLDALIMRALAKDPNDRYPSAADFAGDLKLAFAGKPVSSPPGTTRSLGAISGGTSTRAIPTTRQLIAIRRSPLGIFAIGMVIITALLFVGLLRVALNNTSTTEAVDSMTGDTESMTGDVYFSSTFISDDPFNSYWPQDDTAAFSRKITEDGFYRFFNQRPGKAVTSIFGHDTLYMDASITMEAALESGSSPPSGYGIVFRYVDEDHYNVFAVDGLGRYSIWVREDGQWRELRGAEEDWTRHDAVNPLDKTNKLAVDIVGKHFVGYVNGEMVVSVDDDTIPKGSVGIYLATTSQGQAGVLVDTYQVTEAAKAADSMTGDEE